MTIDPNSMVQVGAKYMPYWKAVNEGKVEGGYPINPQHWDGKSPVKGDPGEHLDWDDDGYLSAFDEVPELEANIISILGMGI